MKTCNVTTWTTGTPYKTKGSQDESKPWNFVFALNLFFANCSLIRVQLNYIKFLQNIIHKPKRDLRLKIGLKTNGIAMIYVILWSD